MEDYSLEGFELLEKIGEGTYGDVYKAKHIREGKIYAIKFVRKAGLNSPLDPISWKFAG